MLVHKTLSQIRQSSLSPSGTISQYPTVNVQSLSLFVSLMTCYHAEFQNIEHEKIERWLVLRLVLNSIRIFRLSLLLHLVTFLIWKVLATAIVWVFHSECIKEILLEPNNYQNSMLFGPISFGLASLTLPISCNSHCSWGIVKSLVDFIYILLSLLFITYMIVV